MANIILFNQPTTASDTIDVRRLRPGLISPMVESAEQTLAEDHTSEPIKSLDDITKITEYLTRERRFRDNMIFILGINFGLRVSDLRQLRFCNLINDDLTFKTTFPVYEIKTRNTRKVKKNRYITINDAVVEAVTMYLENTDNVHLSDYMFRSECTNATTDNVPISRNAIYNMITKLAKDLDIHVKVSTHTLRKTFAYHQMAMSGNDPRKLILLSKMLGHSSVAMTMEYIGLTKEEMESAYLGLNLGYTRGCYIDSELVDSQSRSA